MLRTLSVLVATGIVLSAGCGGPAGSAPATYRSEGEHGHSHEREKMKLADAGPAHHAALTAHLSSKEGNELDIFFETSDADHKPTPLPLAKVVAKAKTATGTEHELVFEPAPMDERKDDPPGACSHFVAKAGWMTPADVLTVTTTVDVDGKPRHVKWTDFNPKQYAHFEE